MIELSNKFREKSLIKYFIFLKVWKNQIVFKNEESYRGRLKQHSCATGLSKMFSFERFKLDILFDIK